MSIATIKNDLRARIIADGTVAGLIVARFYNGKAGQNPALPYCISNVISDALQYTHDDDTAKKPIGPLSFQVDVFADNADSADAVADAITDLLRGTKFTQGTTDFGSVFVDNLGDFTEDLPKTDGRTGVHRRAIQIRTIVNQ